MKKMTKLLFAALLGMSFYGFSADYAFFKTQVGDTLMVDISASDTVEKVERQIAKELGSKDFRIINHNSSGKHKFAGALAEGNFDAWRSRCIKVWRSFQKKSMGGVIIMTPSVKEEQGSAAIA